LNSLKWPLSWLKLLGRSGNLDLQPVEKLVIAALLALTRAELLGLLLLLFERLGLL
jgi:hypothetical protein